MPFAVDLHEHLIQKVGIAKSRVLAPKVSGKFGTKFINPEPNGFIADDVAFKQKILHISDNEIEPVVEPDRILDDRRRESMSLVEVFHLDMLPESQLTCQYPQPGNWEWRSQAIKLANLENPPQLVAPLRSPG